MKVLMVCLGNICRSPIAHGILQQRVEDLGLDWEIDSCGTNGYHDGELPHRRSISCSKRHGIDITYQRSRRITSADYKKFDMIFVMDDSNYEDVLELAPKNFDKSKMRKLCELTGQNNKNVPDPWYDDTDASFESVFKLVDENIRALILQETGKEVKPY